MVGTLYDNDGVTILEENHFNSWNSQLWRRVRNTFSVDLENMYRTLRSNGLFTLENMLTYFDAVTDIISPKMYNDSQQIKYINDGAVGMVALHGNRKLQIRKWLRERIAYLDSKYGYYAGGGVGENYCNFRMNYQGAVSLDLTTYYTVYAKVRWATNNEQTIRIARGQKKTFSYYSDVGTDREVMIFLPESLKTIENISKIYPNSIDVSKATKLTKIEAHNTNLFSVDLSKNKYLRTVNFNGCERLGTETATMTLNFCKYLNKVDLRGTQITAVNFNTKGGSLREIYFPKTIQSVNLLNQLLLTDMVLPLGEDGSNAPVGLATITIENCPNIIRMNDTTSNPVSLNAMKYCRNLTLNNAIKLEKFNFYGFTRLANVNLQNMETLKEVDFLNMAEKGQETSLKYIGVSACPSLTKITMNCDNPNYEITWAEDGLLDLQTAGAIEEITSNCIIKGLKTIVLPRSIKGLYFTDEYGSGYSSIKNIWSAEASTIVKTGVYPIPYHLDSSNVVDEYEGIDFRGLSLANIDLGALVNIPEAINFSLYPTHINPNFNKNRDGTTLPYLQPNGILDLSNYTASLAKFFNGVDLNKMTLICNNQLPQTDLSYCFYNCFFSDMTEIMPLISKLDVVTNLDYCFYKSVVSIDVFENFTLGSGASMNYTFGECNNITSLEDLVIPPSVRSSEGVFFKCPIKTVTNVKINTNGSCKEIFKDNKKLVSITNLTIPNVTNLESAFENCVLLDELPLKEIGDRTTNISRMYYNCSNPTDIDGFSFGSSITNSTDWINKELIITANDVVIKNNSMTFENFTSLQYAKNLSRPNSKNWNNFFKNCVSLKEDLILPTNTTSAISCFENCRSMTHVHSNWKQTYNGGITATNCYTGCINITHHDGVDIGVNEYISGLDEIPITWGGYEFTKTTTGIYIFKIPNDNYTLELRDNSTEANTHGLLSHKVVSWGDGSSTTSEWSHTYSKQGTYIVKMHGFVNRGYYSHSSITECITEIIKMPSIDTTFAYAFANCTKLTKANINNINGTYYDLFTNSSIKEIECYNATLKGYCSIFNGCTSLEKIQGLETCNTSGVTSFANLFKDCKLITELDISTWNSPNVLDYSYAFSGMTNLSVLKLPSILTAEVFTRTFYNCTSLLDLSGVTFEDIKSNKDGYNVDSQLGMTAMFANCKLLKNIGTIINRGGTRNMFTACNNLEVIEEFQFANSFAEYDTYQMFASISGTVELDINFTVSGIGPSYFVGITNNNTFDKPNFTRETVVKLFNCLSNYAGADYLGSSTHPLKFKTTVRAKLTDSDIAIATSKGWSIA